MSQRTRVLAGLAAEVSIAVLPLLVILLVAGQARQVGHFFSSPEWSFGAAIFFGQTLVKFVSGLVRGKGAAGPVALVVALLVVLGLVPSLVVLAMTLQLAEAKVPPELWLEVSQIALFCMAALLYMLLGTVTESMGPVVRDDGADPA